MSINRAEAKRIIMAVANWEPLAPSVELTDADRQALREQIATEIAPLIGSQVNYVLGVIDMRTVRDKS